MRTNGLWFLLSALAVFVLLTSPAITGQITSIVRTNAQGEIVLDKPTIVGQTMLPPGRYSVHSHGSGTRQEVHFAQETVISTAHPESSQVTVYDEMGRVSCDTKPQTGVERVTALHFVTDDNGTMRIVSADIKGEDHTHVF